jgi:hypothetical protein
MAWCLVKHRDSFTFNFNNNNNNNNNHKHCCQVIKACAYECQGDLGLSIVALVFPSVVNGLPAVHIFSAVVGILASLQLCLNF